MKQLNVNAARKNVTDNLEETVLRSKVTGMMSSLGVALVRPNFP